MKQGFIEWIRRHPRILNTLLAAFSLLVALITVEVGFRFYVSIWKPDDAALLRKYTRTASLENTRRRFQPHPYLSYVPSQIRYASDGMFIREQFFPFQKSPGITRIACLGASTTMNQYPVYLPDILNVGPGNPKFEVMDFGCDGWTLTESTINYLIRVSDFYPDIVLVHHGVNDGPPRFWPNFVPDDSHFRQTWHESRIPWLIRKGLAFSWVGGFVIRLLGVSDFDIQNLTMRRVPQVQIRQQPAPDSLVSYERNLRMLAAVVKSEGGLLIVAPMAYNREKGSPLDLEMIEDCNRVMRTVAGEFGLRLAETDSLLRKHPEWFRDRVHLDVPGNLLKAQVYSMVIRDELGEYEPGSDHHAFGERGVDIPDRRDLEIRWTHAPENVREYHIYMQKKGEKKSQYLGRTFPGTRQSYRWKADDPTLVPILKPEFLEGARFGFRYYFVVVAISGENPPKPPEWMGENDGVWVFERPWRTN